MVFSACHIWTLFTCYLHMYMSSTHYLGISVLCAHYLQWSLICSFLTDNADVIHMSSLVLFIYPIMYNLSFCTLSAQMHIVHVICMLSTHVHIICLSSLPCLIYLIIHNLVSAHCLHACILSMSSVYCLEMYMLCTCHLYCCYLYMYMSSTYYLGIYVLCAHHLQWSLISSFLTDNTNIIHTSSLVVFIYSIMENMSSAPLLDDVSSTPLPDDMSSALQRNMSYLFEVWEASNRSTRQLVWFIWLFDWLA